jgi:hypothetical protein
MALKKLPLLEIGPTYIPKTVGRIQNNSSNDVEALRGCP